MVGTSKWNGFKIIKIYFHNRPDCTAHQGRPRARWADDEQNDLKHTGISSLEIKNWFQDDLEIGIKGGQENNLMTMESNNIGRLSD